MLEGNEAALKSATHYWLRKCPASMFPPHVTYTCIDSMYMQAIDGF